MDRSSARNSLAAPVRIATSTGLPPTIALKAKVPQALPSAPPAENPIKDVILDYLLYASTQARLTQANQELKGTAGDRPRPTVPQAKPSPGVEAIVEGLLQSHRTQADAVLLSTPLKYRLYLCALTNSIFNRSNPSAYLSSTNLHAARQGSLATLTASSSSSTASNAHHLSTSNASPHKSRSHSAHPTLSKFERFFKNSINPPRCRRHRLKVCGLCHSHQGRTAAASSRKFANPVMGRPSRQQSGLFDAIPAFIHTSVLAYRQGELHDSNDRIASGWYSLLLDLLTQAAIECYLCDSHSSMDALLEIFSYGDVDPSEYHAGGNEDVEEDEDDYLLWQRSPSLDEFRAQKVQRREEFLNVKGGIEKHFEALAKKYLVRDFEEAMYEYCSKVMASMKPPEMLKFRNKAAAMNDQPLSELIDIPGQSHNGIAIPVSDDEDDEGGGGQAMPMARDERERCATRRSNGSTRSDDDFAGVVPMQVSTPPKRAAEGEDDDDGEQQWRQLTKKRRDGASST